MATTSSRSRFRRVLESQLVARVAQSFAAHAHQLVFTGAVALALFLYLALFSFTVQDPSPFSVSIGPTQNVQNASGAWGAYLAGTMLYLFGYSAFFWPLLVCIYLYVGRGRPATFHLGAFGCMLALHVGMALTDATLPYKNLTLSLAGALGEIISHPMYKALGKGGAWLFVATMFVMATILLTSGELQKLFRRWRRIPTESESSQEPSIPRVSIAETVVSAPVFQEPSLFKEQVTYTARTQEAKTPYLRPSLEIFRRSEASRTSTLAMQREQEATAKLIKDTFAEFDIPGAVIGYQPGPVVTVYEFQPEAGVKQSRVFSLIEDIALSLKVDSIFIHPVSGKRALGIQVPNQRRETVYLGDILASEVFELSPSPLTFAMGRTISGHPYCVDLSAMPHLLVAGATGTGKSVGINSLLCSIIMKSSPDEVRMILVDPKMLELSVYEGIPHLLMPVITESERASTALKWAANEMERRYKVMQHAQVRNIASFNQFWLQAPPERRQEICTLMQDDTISTMPYILLVIDELADLMLTAPKDVENSIQRLAQKARASGIHMVLATQRPSVDIITGVIKANLPCRLSFQVVSKHDSRTILDQMGSEKLLGKGDMLLQRPGVGKLERLQGALVSDEEVLALAAAAKAKAEPSYDDRIMGWIDEEMSRSKTSGDDLGGDQSACDDVKFNDAVALAKMHGIVSASFLQRHLKIGYNRAARMVEYMEANGLVAKADGAKPRKWLGPSI